jgi:hypothetical protein
MAAPMVNGGVALMLQKDPNLSPDTVKAASTTSSPSAPDILTCGPR